ncbi:Ribonuclease H-like domain,Transposase, type 1 [Cinara cedri]|uniref:Ribonuclease H-like domain,Transposase, type 1 n=1 Tax=Cinara cedri TaxID=506608 RepID=A0A5E4MBI4_9HEMI|nr:Ribonuclease H-like domain,Transposase, type 1 [Cinara cedri]
MLIESAAKCEIRAVIRYLVAKEKSPYEIFNEVRTVYGEGHMNPKKIVALVFWDHKGIILIEYLPHGETINAARYCETLKKLRRAIQNKRRGLLTSGICLLHDKARPHTANVTKQLLDSFGCDVLNHPPYSPDLAPSDYHLFTSLKKHMGGKKCSTDEEVKGAVDKWTKEMAAEFYDAGIKKLICRLTACIERNGDYVEK